MCIAGKPEPSVKWLLNGEVIDAECEQNVGDVIENRLAYRAVGRHDLGARFTCQASNTALAEPREAALTLDLHREYRRASPAVVALGQPAVGLRASATCSEPTGGSSSGKSSRTRGRPPLRGSVRVHGIQTPGGHHLVQGKETAQEGQGKRSKK